MASYALGAFLLDVEAGQLRRGSDPIALPPKVFDLLIYLVENRGRLVRHHELLDALWPTSDVGAASLTRAVADLRRALSDDADDPQYVQTVPRRGYRLISPVSELGDERPQGAPFGLVYKGRTYRLRIGENIVGRSDDSVVPIHSPSVSRQHARVTVTEAGATVHDLDSKNGTYIGEQRLAGETAIADGDEMRVGPIRLLFVRAADDRSTITERPSSRVRSIPPGDESV